MLAWQLCDFSGDQDQYCQETLYFVTFQVGGGGGGGPDPMSPPSGSFHDVAMSSNAICENKVLAKRSDFTVFSTSGYNVSHFQRSNLWPILTEKNMRGSRGGRGPDPPPLKNHKNTGFLATLARIPSYKVHQHSMFGHHRPACEMSFK